jgi:cytochrome bd-type quinol oxidase subunit 2
MIPAILRLFSGFSFKEKSILISLLAVAGLYGAYFLDLVSGNSEQTLASMLTNMFGLVVALVMVHVIFHIVITLDDVSEQEDERDRAVGRRASVFGYNVLYAIVLLVTGRMVILGAWAERAQNAQAVAPSTFETANLLLAGLVLSEVVYYAMQLFFYRRVYG